MMFQILPFILIEGHASPLVKGEAFEDAGELMDNLLAAEAHLS